MNILSLSWFVRNMQSYHILTCRDKTGKIHIYIFLSSTCMISPLGHGHFPIEDLMYSIWFHITIIVYPKNSRFINFLETYNHKTESFLFISSDVATGACYNLSIYIYINNPKSIQIPYRLLYPHDHIPWYSHDISIPYEWFLGPSATGFFFPFILLYQTITAFCFRWDSSISMVPFQKVHGSISSLNHSPTCGNNMK